MNIYETITLNFESKGGGGCSGNTEVREKGLVTTARRCDEVERKMGRRRE